MNTKKYGRTYHFPFSPGTTSDDRIQHDSWNLISKMKQVIHTEKLDGENNCLNKYGVFARSHAAPTTSPWTTAIRQRWQRLQHDLGDLEIFGENIYAIHSIEYKKIEHHYFVFAIRCLDEWLSWEEVEFYAKAFDFPIVPILGYSDNFASENDFKNNILNYTLNESDFVSVDMQTQKPCTIEGVVTRNITSFNEEMLCNNVFKYVRKGHVKTDAHWTKNWKRAKLLHELPPN